MSDPQSARMSEKPLPAFGQTFVVTVHPSHPQLPEFSLVWMPRSTDDPESELYSLSLAFDDDVGPPALELRDFRQTNTTMVDSVLAWHLKAGMIGPFGPDDADYFKTASMIRDTAEIPFKASPLQGTTLASLIGGSGSTAAVLEIFHNGVTPAEATVSVLFVAGAMIVLGTANAVRRALEAGLERKPLSIFGVEQDKAIATKREDAVAKSKVMSRAKKARAQSGTESPEEPGKMTTAAYADRDLEVIPDRAARKAGGYPPDEREKI